MPKIKYLGSQSSGQPLKKGKTKSVVVTVETLITPDGDDYGFDGDTVTYNATVKDNEGLTLPAAFVADLIVNGTILIANKDFESSVYNATTGALSLEFIVPNDTILPIGDYTVKLKWLTQKITVP